MATTQPPTPANPARWRFAQVVTLTGATLAGLLLIQFAAASRDVASQILPTVPPPHKSSPRPTAANQPAFSSSREAKQGKSINVASRLAPTATATRLPASRPSTAPSSRPAAESKVAKLESVEKVEQQELDDSEAQLASDRIPRAAPSAAPTAAAAPDGRELLHDLRPPLPPAAARHLVAVEAPKRTGRVLRLQATAYCPCPRCCGSKAEGITASGLPVTYDGGRFAAADTAVLPFGTKLIVPGYAAGRPVEVIDRGGAIKGMRVDVFFPTHEQAKAWGRRWVNVTVVE